MVREIKIKGLLRHVGETVRILPGESFVANRGPLGEYWERQSVKPVVLEADSEGCFVVEDGQKKYLKTGDGISFLVAARYTHSRGNGQFDYTFAQRNLKFRIGLD